MPLLALPIVQCLESRRELLKRFRGVGDPAALVPVGVDPQGKGEEAAADRRGLVEPGREEHATVAVEIRLGRFREEDVDGVDAAVEFLSGGGGRRHRVVLRRPGA